MRPITAILASLLATTALFAQQPAKQVPLRVLYAGQPGHARTAEFVSFFGERFTKVGQIDAKDLSKVAAADWDVVFVDLPHDYDWKEFQQLSIPQGFDRPTVLSGCWAARLGEGYKLKLNDG